MAIRIGINGFGRIGRLVYRATFESGDFEIAAVNDLVDADNLAYLLKYDTVHGRFGRDVRVTDSGFAVDGVKTACLSERGRDNRALGLSEHRRRRRLLTRRSDPTCHSDGDSAPPL